MKTPSEQLLLEVSVYVDDLINAYTLPFQRPIPVLNPEFTQLLIDVQYIKKMLDTQYDKEDL